MSSPTHSITQLPARFKRPWRSEKGATSASTAHDKLDKVRSKRAVGFFRAKARQRAGAQALAAVIGSSGGAVTSLLRTLRHLVTGFFSRKRGALTAMVERHPNWKKRLRLLPSALTGAKSVLSLIQRTLERTIGRGAKAQAGWDRRQKRVGMHQWVCRALARLGRSATAAAYKVRRAEGAALLSREIVDRLMNEQPPVLAVKLVAVRERERLATHARVIQRLWRRVKRNELAGIEAKARLLGLLASMPSCIRLQQQGQQQRLEAVHKASTSAATYFVRRATQRLAARLIQRVWRGHRARARVRRTRDWKLRRALRRRQRERLREARGALLAPSEQERKHKKALETRMLARQQETPLLPLPRRDEGRHYQRRRGERATLLEPLPLQSRPPQVSSTTRTKVQCVPFSRFEKIVAQDARVNLSNVWVAIPVGHLELPQDKEESRHGGLSPLLVGRGRKKKTGGLQTTYDWVPAHLLQSKEEREATASRRRQRVKSPSIATNILEF
ncbi:hypothetical protein KRP22_004506 [Phytophthora ramorum]|nr:hypothetical protein KRP22_14329 [Phytophthora ramorum]